MNAKHYTRNIATLLLALTLLGSSLLVSTIGFRYGQSSGGADYAIFEGTAGNDWYDRMQYSYQVNEWAKEEWNLLPSFDPGDDYYDAAKSLRVGMTEYGEFASPEHAGIAYGNGATEWANTESWASIDILSKYWIQGWLLLVNYTRAGVYRKIIAYAIYSDMITSEAGRKVYSWYGAYAHSAPGAQLTAGSLVPSGIKVLYDSARLVVARACVTIYDAFYDEDFARITFTIVYNKVSKYALVYKDIKILLDPKIIDSIEEFTFSERYELDMIRKINSANRAYIHYYHNYNDTVYQHPLTGETTYDALQAFDPLRRYIFFAGYWPNTTEYSVWSPLVPDVPNCYLRVLPVGFARPDIPEAPTGPGEPSTPWVLVQWRYNNTEYPRMLAWLTDETPKREIRFVEVIGMTDYTQNPYPAKDAKIDTVNQLDTEVWYLLDQKVFNPEDLRNIHEMEELEGAPGETFQWTGLGQSAATTDSAGAGLLPDMPQYYLGEPFMLFDRNDTLFPWTWSGGYAGKGTIPYGLEEFGGNYYEQFSNSGKGTGTDTTLYKRTVLKKFVFDLYDDDYLSPPQPIAGGWSYYGTYWYPSKDPLTQRWAYPWTPAQYDDVDLHPNGIISLGSPKANGLTRYFNDFSYAISREGPNAYALINGGAVTGTAPTSDFSLGTFDFFPISTWDSMDTFDFKEGYAIISIVRDINGTRGLEIFGWDGRDTFWAAAWASQFLGQFNGWIPPGALAVILKIDYTTWNREPSRFTVVKILGTITELGWNDFAEDPAYGFDKLPAQSWYAYWDYLYTYWDYEYPALSTYPTPYPSYRWPYSVWWFEKLYTELAAHIQFDP